MMKRSVDGSGIELDENTGQVFLHSVSMPRTYTSSMRLRHLRDNTGYIEIKTEGTVICSPEALQSALEMLEVKEE